MLDFAEYTRHSLARHGDYTTVAGEFQAIEAYLALARAVLGDRLRVQVRIAPEILPVALPYLALQPLVENAVRHGVELPGGSGLVQVSGEADGTRVRDRGGGRRARAWTRSYAAAVLAGQRRARAASGLVNVDRRLRTVFGAGLRPGHRDRRPARAPGCCCGCPGSSRGWWRRDGSRPGCGCSPWTTSPRRWRSCAGCCRSRPRSPRWRWPATRSPRCA